MHDSTLVERTGLSTSCRFVHQEVACRTLSYLRNGSKGSNGNGEEIRAHGESEGAGGPILPQPVLYGVDKRTILQTAGDRHACVKGMDGRGNLLST
jgi:hypothetical protein